MVLKLINNRNCGAHNRLRWTGICLALVLLAHMAFADAARAESGFVPKIQGLSFVQRTSSGRIALRQHDGQGIAVFELELGSDLTVNRRPYLPGSASVIGLSPDGTVVVERAASGKLRVDLRSRSGRAKIGARKFLGFSRDGSALFFTNNGRQKDLHDLFSSDLSTGTRDLLLENAGALQFRPASLGAWFDNGAGKILAESIKSADDSALVIAGYRGDGGENIVDYPDSLQSPVSFDCDGRSAYFLSDHLGEFQRLYRYDPADNSAPQVFATDGDVTLVRLAPDCGSAFLEINDHGSSRLLLIEMNSKSVRWLGSVPGDFKLRDAAWFNNDAGVAVGSSPGETAIALFWDADGNISRIDEQVFGPGVTTKFSSVPAIKRARAQSRADGLGIPILIYEPEDTAKGAFIWLHGGPRGAATSAYSSLRTALLSKGVLVAEPDYRGSDGFGKSFSRLNEGIQGGAQIEDILGVRDFLIEQYGLNSDSIILGGGSSGGYLTLQTAVDYGTLFGAFVDLFGVTDWADVLDAMPEDWSHARRLRLLSEVGDQETNRERQSSFPAWRSTDFARPLLVVHGANDKNVPISFSRELVANLRQLRKHVEFLELPNQGHGMPLEREIASQAIEKIMNFVLENLGVEK